MLGVEIFTSSKPSELRYMINRFLDDNPEIDIVDIKFSSNVYQGEQEDWFGSVLVIYKAK